MKHVQEISSDANQIVPIGDTQNPLKPWFAEMKISREEELHLGIWSRRNPGTTKKQRKEVKKRLRQDLVSRVISLELETSAHPGGFRRIWMPTKKENAIY
jgi:hypothetical protein